MNSRFHYASKERESHGDLFDTPKDVTQNRHGGNPESIEAFRSLNDRLTEQQERVLKAIRESDNGMTCDELAVKLGVTPNMVSGRCSELKRDGKIETRGTRLTRNGHPAAVLKAV